MYISGLAQDCGKKPINRFFDYGNSSVLAMELPVLQLTIMRWSYHQMSFMVFLNELWEADYQPLE